MWLLLITSPMTGLRRISDNTAAFRPWMRKHLVLAESELWAWGLACPSALPNIELASLPRWGKISLQNSILLFLSKKNPNINRERKWLQLPFQRWYVMRLFGVFSQQIPDVRVGQRMEMPNSTRNSHTERVTHPLLVLGEQFFVEMQPKLQDDSEMSYQECQGKLWSLLQLKK